MSRNIISLTGSIGSSVDRTSTALFILAVVIVSSALVGVANITAYAGYLIDENSIEIKVSEGRMLRQGHGTTMLDLQAGWLWITGFKKPVYWEGTVDEYCRFEREKWLEFAVGIEEAMAKKSQAERASMQPWIRSLFEEVRERLRRVRGERGAGPLRIIVKKTNETKIIAGQLTRKCLVQANAKLYEEVWLTTDTVLAHELSLKSAPETLGRLLACITQDFGGVQETREYRRLYSLGWPLRTISYMHAGRYDPKGVVMVEAIVVKRIDVPEEEFEAPTDLEKVPLRELFD